MLSLLLKKCFQYKFSLIIALGIFLGLLLLNVANTPFANINSSQVEYEIREVDSISLLGILKDTSAAYIIAKPSIDKWYTKFILKKKDIGLDLFEYTEIQKQNYRIRITAIFFGYNYIVIESKNIIKTLEIYTNDFKIMVDGNEFIFVNAKKINPLNSYYRYTIYALAIVIPLLFSKLNFFRLNFYQKLGLFFYILDITAQTLFFLRIIKISDITFRTNMLIVIQLQAFFLIISMLIYLKSYYIDKKI